VLGILGCAVLVMVWRAFDLQIVDTDFLQGQGDARHLRTIAVAAHRGMITDRNGEPLAISTPVDSVWANPGEMQASDGQWLALGRLLGLDADYLRERIASRAGREFVYLKRRLNPDVAREVMALGIPGVSLQREYRRFYPAGEVAAHVVGFTNIDDVGQEGLELAYDEWLRGTPGRKRVLKDRLGRIVENVERVAEPAPGKDLKLSLDLRLQYLAYRELKTAVRLHKARSGSAVILDAATGEVLAMVNQPSYNPNSPSRPGGGQYRNRAVTDVFEPGSTVKPLTVAAALEAGKYRPDTIIETAPGRFRVGRNMIRDSANYGAIDVTTVIQKSSNVGASKIALSLDPEQLWGMFSRVGFGSVTGSSFPGEAGGKLSDYMDWHEIEQATISFGYGLAVTTLQLARAYAVLADHGRLKPASLFPVTDAVRAEQVLSPGVAAQVVSMMESVVTRRGTGLLAHVRGYRVAGKTGTVQKTGRGGYSDERYIALFVGMAPASDPRLVMAVVVDEPRGEEYYGGRVAAPVFSSVMTGALRLLGVPPDDVPGSGLERDGGRLAQQDGRDPRVDSGTRLSSLGGGVM
ncbi:MAG TPA: penicillin-binding protein 2, partial [Chromatiales bacterium]|nr:penicillin-binding protein 2 [Chromatiales bacterium]